MIISWIEPLFIYRYKSVDSKISVSNNLVQSKRGLVHGPDIRTDVRSKVLGRTAVGFMLH
jgi:hypothetical protein